MYCEENLIILSTFKQVNYSPIMYCEVYGKRELSPLVGLSKKQSGKSSARGGNKSRRRK